MASSYEDEYLQIHSKRNEHLLHFLKKYIRSDSVVGVVGYSMFDLNIISTLKNCEVYNIIPKDDFIRNRDDSVKRRVFLYDVTAKLNNVTQIEFDALIFTEVLEHIFSEDSMVISNISKLVKKGGYLFFSVPNVSAFGKIITILLGKNPYMTKEQILNGSFGGFGHIREYSFQEVRNMLTKEFNIIKLLGWNDYPTTFNKIAKVLPKIYAETIFALCSKL